MTDYLRTPDTPADTLRDTLLGACGLARSTSSEPKTENTDAVLNARAASGSTAGCPGRNAAAHVGHHPRRKARGGPQLCHLRHALRQHKGL